MFSLGLKKAKKKWLLLVTSLCQIQLEVIEFRQMGIPLSGRHGNIFQWSSESLKSRAKAIKGNKGRSQLQETISTAPFSFKNRWQVLQSQQPASSQPVQTAQSVTSWALWIQVHYPESCKNGPLINLGVCFDFYLAMGLCLCSSIILIFMWMWEKFQGSLTSNRSPSLPSFWER